MGVAARDGGQYVRGGKYVHPGIAVQGSIGREFLSAAASGWKYFGDA